MKTAHHWRAALACLLLSLFLLGTPAPGQDGKVGRDGFDLHYRTAGKGPPVVLLSGGPGLDVDYLVPMAEHLPASYQRVFLEQRGTGRSKPPELNAKTMSLKLVVEDVEALRVHLQQERLFLVGHSWGGELAMMYAAAHPERVDRLILIGSPGPSPRFREWFHDNITARMRPEDTAAVESWMTAEKRRADPDKAMLEAVKAMTPAYFFDRSKGLAFAAKTPDGSLHAQVHNLLIADLEKNPGYAAGLKSLQRPVLIMHGHQDPIGDLSAEEIHRAIAGSQIRYIARSGHFPWIEQPEKFRSIVAEFLKTP